MLDGGFLSVRASRRRKRSRAMRAPRIAYHTIPFHRFARPPKPPCVGWAKIIPFSRRCSSISHQKLRPFRPVWFQVRRHVSRKDAAAFERLGYGKPRPSKARPLARGSTKSMRSLSADRTGQQETYCLIYFPRSLRMIVSAPSLANPLALSSEKMPYEKDLGR